MAILPAFPGLTVEILVNGVPLQEYDDEDEELESPNTIAEYIEARSGTQFSVRCISSQRLPVPDSTMQIFLDGTQVTSTLHRKDEFRFDDPYIKKGRISVDGQQTVEQAFQFS